MAYLPDPKPGRKSQTDSQSDAQTSRCGNGSQARGATKIGGYTKRRAPVYSAARSPRHDQDGRYLAERGHPSTCQVTETQSSVPSIPRRMACWTYEGLLMFGVVFVAAYLFSSLSQTRNAMDNRNALQAFLFVIFGIYFVWFWAKGQSLAMKTWDIRVVDKQGQRITQKRALLRYVFSWLWFLPPLLYSWLFKSPAIEGAVLTLGWVAVWAILARFHPDKQFWHDAIAGTRLIIWKTPESPKRLARLAAK